MYVESFRVSCKIAELEVIVTMLTGPGINACFVTPSYG